MCYHNGAMACYVSHIDQDTWSDKKKNKNPG